jgi:gluconokinase
VTHDRDNKARVIIVMGVAGAGKTTVGQALAATLGWKFYDADVFHSPENVDKMSRGEALSDADRIPWLARLRSLIASVIHRGDAGVLACSALKQWYRDALVPKDAARNTVHFVFLDAPVHVLRERLVGRKHYFAASLLDSQLATLEPPADALCVDATNPVSDIVQTIRDELGL